MIRNPVALLPSIRAKFASVIAVAIAGTLGLVFVLLSVALRNDFRDADLVRLLAIAREQADLTVPAPPDGISIVILEDDGFRWFGPVLGEPPRYPGGVHVGVTETLEYAAVPVAEGRQLYAVQPAPGLIVSSTRFLRERWPSLLAAGVVAGAIAIVLARLVARGMTRPLRDMAAAVARMEAGDYDQRVSTASRDEVGQLAAAFNRMAAQVGALEGLRRDLVANVSHELKTPISALRANLENLLDGVGAPDPVALRVMLEQTERLGRLVDQLLDLSRLESGALTLAREPVDLRELAERVVAEIAVATGDRDLRLRIDAAASLPAVAGDRERLHQVLFNLLDNAARYSPAGGEVTVALRASDGGVAIDVSDRGAGIASEDLPRIFERFYRVDAARTSRDGGTGLGLAIVRSIVEAHGGRVVARSTPGAGATFTVELPRDGGDRLPALAR